MHSNGDFEEVLTHEELSSKIVVGENTTCRKFLFDTASHDAFRQRLGKQSKVSSNVFENKTKRVPISDDESSKLEKSVNVTFLAMAFASPLL